MYTSVRLFAILAIAASAVYPSLSSPLACVHVPINATPTNLLVLVPFAATLTLFKLAVTLQNPLAMKMENHAAAGNSA